MTSAELQEAIRKLPPLPEAPDFWTYKYGELRQRLIEEGPERFLAWSCVTATMFVGDAPYLEAEVNYLTTCVNSVALPLLLRDCGKGAPDRLSLMRFGIPALYAVLTSGNYIHQLYHLMRWRTEATPVAVANILEFGGGYGVLALLYQRQFFGDHRSYLIYDAPEMQLLQQWYLSQEGVDGILYPQTWEEATQGDIDLTIALFSMSETPREDWQRYTDAINSRYVLIACTLDGGFVEHLQQDQRYTWQVSPIDHIPNTTYVYGRKNDL